MRQSPRRPLILKRRKLPFQHNDDPPHDEPDGLKRSEPSHASGARCSPDGVRIMDHPTMPDTQVVVIPKTAHLQSVIGALTAKGKECGQHGPNKFILLSGSGSLQNGPESFCQPGFEGGVCSGSSNMGLPDSQTQETTAIDSLLDTKTLTTIKPLNRDLDCSPLDDSLTNIQWLGRMSTDGLGPDDSKKTSNKENLDASAQNLQLQGGQVETGGAVMKDPLSERPPYSYMAMIQFAINSKRNRRMTLKEIYTWIEDNFPYFRHVAKPGWKNSIRHNLSLHDMFIRETTPDGKVSYWTIRPEANRCLTLDQVYKPGGDPSSSPSSQTLQVCDQQQQKRIGPEIKKPACAPERKMKPLLPRTDSYLVPIQLPITPSLYLSSSSQLPLPALLQKSRSTGGGKRVRIAPKVTHCDLATSAVVQVKEEQAPVSLSAEASGGAPPSARREVSSSRRKQRLVLPANEEPVLLFSDSTFFDSGLASDASAFQDTREAEPDQQPDPDSPSREYSFKTPIKSSHPASSTPSKPPLSVAPEPWRVTPLGKESQAVLDFSPIRTPGGSSLTPQRHDYTPFSFNSTPFKDLPLFSSPRELLTSGRSCPRTPAPADSPQRPTGGCARELQVGGAVSTQANRSLTEGLVLDTMNDSLTKILVDISFSGLEDDDLGMGNISWSQLIPEFK